MPELNLGRVVGPSGKSAYQYAVEGGYTGTEAEFQALMGSGPWVPEAGFVPADENILINSYFGPGVINRNGFTTSTVSRITVDCWMQNAWKGAAGTLTESGMQLEPDNGFIQVIRNYSDLDGKTVTGSVLTADGRLFTVTKTFESSVINDVIVEGTVGFRIGNVSWKGLIGFIFWVTLDYGEPITFLAAQLEPGDHQTLARKNEAGTWELIKKPNPDLQYLLTGQYSPITGEWMGKVGNQISNPNLLDNWYFGTGVINQRGLTFYSFPSISSQYTIDRWKLGKGSNLTLTDEGVSLVETANTYDSFLQIIEPNLRKYLTGKTVTLSALTKGGVGQLGETNGYQAHIPMSEDWVLSKITYTFRAGDTYAKQHPLISPKDPENALIVHCMKLEEGAQQTLARKDSSGNWVLNDPPPNPALELEKCMKYQIQIVNSFWSTKSGMVGNGTGYGADRAYINIPIPSKCDGNPALSYSGTWVLWPPDNSLGSAWASGIPVTSMEPYYVPGNQLNVRVFVNSGIVPFKEYALIHLPNTTANSLLLDKNI